MQWKNWKRFCRFLSLPAALCCAVLCMGVEQCDFDSENPDSLLSALADESDPTPPKAVISIHSIVKYPRGENSIEKNITSYSGEQVWINSLPLISSQDIKEVKIIPRENEPDMYDLHLFLTDRGRKMWIGLSVGFKGTQLAFVVDGMLYRRFEPRMIYDDVSTDVIVDGPFDPATALEIQNNSKKTYRKMSRK